MKKVFILLLFLTACSPPTRNEFVFQKKMAPKELIVIDAGHGGKDSGASSRSYEEKELTLDTAKMVNDYLEELGYRTLMTREDDTYLSLSQRANLANDANAHLFVSIHYNHSPNPEAKGIEIFYYKGETNERLKTSRKLGETVIQKIAHHTNATSRGVKKANYAVVRETKMPAILIEVGFLSNKEELARIKDPRYRRYVAWAISRGIDAHLHG